MSWRIRDSRTGHWSHGTIQQLKYNFPHEVIHYILFSAKTKKEWKTEKALKAHLLKWLLIGKEIYPEWEVVETATMHPAPAINWCDAKMTMALLKQVA